MITFGLVLLFICSAIAVAISLSDSALRGARAFKQLSKAVQIDRMDYASLVSATAAQSSTVCASPAIIRKSNRKPGYSMDYLHQLPVAA